MDEKSEKKDPPKPVAMKCRHGSCKGMEAECLSDPKDHSKLYCCTTCKHTIVLQTGGFFPL